MPAEGGVVPKTTEEYAAISAAQAQNQLITREVFHETNAQLTQWGVQNHPTGAAPVFKELADQARSACQAAADAGSLTWAHILEEEYWEAMAEEDPEAFEMEMIQVAAVAVSAVASSRRARGA